MRYEATSTELTWMLLFGACFAACAAVDLFLSRRIVIASGQEWNINMPWKRVRAEQAAIRALPPGRLRTQYRINQALAFMFWLAALLAMTSHTWLGWIKR